jgi:hypothetical protein
MRHAHSTFPWFLALTLSCWSACADLFSVPACEFDRNSKLCMQQMGDGMGGQLDGALPDAPPAMPDLAPRPSMGSPVTFTLVAKLDLNNSTTNGKLLRNWVGIRSADNILFANQATGMPDANIESYKLSKSESQTSGWELKYNICASCPSQIKNVNLNVDYVLTSKSMIFALRSNGLVYPVSVDGSLAAPLNSIVTPFVDKFRPFVSPDLDVISYQRKSTATINLSEFNFYASQGSRQSIGFAERSYIAPTTYYSVGDLEGQRRNLSDNEILIFEYNNLSGAYRFNASLTPAIDKPLTDEINKALHHDNPIRSVFISDLNKDGYVELIYAQHQQIFVVTYNPDAKVGSKFTIWKNPIVNIDQDHTLTLSVADLDGDGYPEIAVETSNNANDDPTFVYFYLNNAK